MMDEIKVTKKYKDRLFTNLFGAKDKKANLLSLFNALNGTSYTDEDKLQITTIENVVYMGMYNDVSCIIDNNMALYEHQSTWNPNMPLRGFMYAGKLYDKYVIQQDISLYGKELIKLPTPQYYVLYNGTDETEDRMELRLSDAFVDQSVKEHYEWTAVLLNVNYGRNTELMEQCRTLAEYAQCVALVREYTGKTSDWRSAIRDAVDECIQRGILKEYLLANKSEVVDMLLTEYNEQKTMNQLRREGEQAGIKIGEEIGKKIGKKLGEQQTMERVEFVVSKLSEQGRLEELKQIKTDKNLLYRLADEFGFEEGQEL